MERETIERLTMDRALGELDTDTTALLEAYLGDHPEAQVWAQAMSQACDRTRAAVDRQTHPVAPAQHEPARMLTRRFAWRAPARWAAVILLSLGIGVTAGRWSRPTTASTETIVVRTQPSQPAKGWRQILSQSERGFWETKAIAMLQPRTEAIPDTHGSGRGLWDRYRQSTKEPSHE